MNCPKKATETKGNLKRAETFITKKKSSLILLQKSSMKETNNIRNSIVPTLNKNKLFIKNSNNKNKDQYPSSTILPKKKLTDHNLQFKAQTPRNSLGFRKTKYDFNQAPQSSKNTEKKIDFLTSLIHKPDFRRTIIIDDLGNNNLNFKPKKLYSENDLFTKISKVNFDSLWAKETALTEASNEIFSPKQRNEIDQIKPFEEDSDDDNESKSESNIEENENVLITSFLSSDIADIDKTFIQGDEIPPPLYTPRQLFSKNNEKAIIEQFLD